MGKKLISRWQGARGEGLSRKSAAIHAAREGAKDPGHVYEVHSLASFDCKRWEVRKYRYE